LMDRHSFLTHNYSKIWSWQILRMLLAVPSPRKLQARRTGPKKAPNDCSLFRSINNILCNYGG
jgi:hypothetical protein